MKPSSSPPNGASRRGRPTKFGRPSQLVAVSLPDNVVAALREVHSDLGWAIVKISEPLLKHDARADHEHPRAVAELAHLPGRRALIVVNENETIFRKLRGVAMIPFGDGRAFLAFDDDGSLDGLELAIVDRLETCPPDSDERPKLEQLRQTLRDWRNEKKLHFKNKTIVVVEGVAR